VLLVVVMVGVGGTFVSIKLRQRALNAKEEDINARMVEAQEAIRQFEELQIKRKAMWKTALTTAELLEPVSKSVLLASLTNNLPPGVSLLKLNLIQKEQKKQSRPVVVNRYEAAQAKKTAAVQPRVSQEKLLETHIDIEGIAPSDLQVAGYIEHLGGARLLDNVSLVESKERKIDDTVYRQFKLKAMLKKDIHLSSRDINKIRAGYEKAIYNF
jgi:Tfp pilus assembly protein PilN